MKPLISSLEDQDSLQALGRASVQIIHDIKNQLNGLKLYATFLRKRMEKGERPPDELETVAKLMAGLERAVSDLSTLVQFGRHIELKKQAGVDLQKVMRGVTASLTSGATGNLAGNFVIQENERPLVGEFDAALLADALKAISVGALKTGSKNGTQALPVDIREDEENGEAVIEWSGLNHIDHDPFASFAGSDEVRMSLAAKIVQAHGGSAQHENNKLSVRLPLAST